MRVIQGKYTNEFRAEAVKLIRRNDRSYRQLAEDLGVNSWTLRDWLKKDEMAKKSKGAKDRPEESAQSSPGSETPEQELVRLRRENERQRKRIESLEMDREILKKAAAFFAKESE